MWGKPIGVWMWCGFLLPSPLGGWEGGKKRKERKRKERKKKNGSLG